MLLFSMCRWIFFFLIPRGSHSKGISKVKSKAWFKLNWRSGFNTGCSHQKQWTLVAATSCYSKSFPTSSAISLFHRRPWFWSYGPDYHHRCSVCTMEKFLAASLAATLVLGACYPTEALSALRVPPVCSQCKILIFITHKVIFVDFNAKTENSKQHNTDILPC